MHNASLITKMLVQPCISSQHVNWNLKGNKKCYNMFISIKTHVYSCCFQWDFSFLEISSFSLCSSEAINLFLWNGNLFPWKWMGCHKCNAMTSFPDRVQEDRQQRKDLRLFQALTAAHCKSDLSGQTMGRSERVEMDWVILGVAWEGDDGCDDDCSLWDGSSGERKEIGLLLFVS